jgi:erythromycin esterase
MRQGSIMTSILIILSVFCQNFTYAQQTINFNFEKTSIENTARPWGWNKKTYASTEISMDSVTKYEGKYSFMMRYNADEENKRVQTMSFGIEPYELHNKIITVKGRIKTEQLTGAAYFSISNGDEPIPIDEDSVSRKISNTSDWEDVSIDFMVPSSTRTVFLKLHHEGNGVARFDDFALIVDGKKLDQVEIAKAFTKKQVKWIKKYSNPLKEIDATPLNGQSVQSFEDLRPFKALVGDAQIIALGESTHGTSDFFRLKHRILEYAVMELDVRIFGIEGNMLIVEKINSYIMGGEGTARESMKGIFSVWYNEEVLNMIEWIRDYNGKHPNDKVEFFGYDVQDIATPLDSLNAFLEERSPELLKTTSVLLEGLTKEGKNYFSQPDSVKLSWLNNSEKVLDLFKEQVPKWFASCKSKDDSLKVYWGLQYANLVNQFARNAYMGLASFDRDMAMAENISWFLSLHKPNTRILIWAHDYHISRGDHANNDLNIYNGLSMGRHLSKKYGDNYKAFALSTYGGDYLGYVGYRDFRQMNCPLHKSPKGTLDEVLHQLSHKSGSLGMFLDLSKARSLSWLTDKLPMRFANHVNIEYGYWTRYSIPYQFDGIFFIDNTKSAKHLVNN